MWEGLQIPRQRFSNQGTLDFGCGHVHLRVGARRVCMSIRLSVCVSMCVCVCMRVRVCLSVCGFSLRCPLAPLLPVVHCPCHLRLLAPHLRYSSPTLPVPVTTTLHSHYTTTPPALRRSFGVNPLDCRRCVS